jgi:D-serine deaminase-like pyridoxal phosphate-dependent protein
MSSVSEPGIGKPLEEQQTPCLLVRLDILRDNIRRMASLAAENHVALRPHAKTHKCVRIARLQVEQGAAGITVSKIAEAEVMAEGGLTDICVAYPIPPSKVPAFYDLSRRASVSVVTDSFRSAEALGAFFSARGAAAPVFLKVDVGLGRCGVDPESGDAVELARRIAALPGLSFRGILTHAGQVYAAPGETVDERRERVREISLLERATMLRFAERLEAAGIPVRGVSVGSTPTAWFFRQAGPGPGRTKPSITEIRPGNYVFHDGTQIRLGAAGLPQCALTVLATVVSRPAKDRVIIDAGSKGISKESGVHVSAPTPEGYGRLLGCDADRSPVEGAGPVFNLSEEHGWVQVHPDCKLDVGDVVQVLPNHACTTVNLFDSIRIVKGGRVVDCWPVDARGRSW